MVVSRLRVQNTACCFSVPRVAITGKEVLYRSEIYETPLSGQNRIDAEAIADILGEEYRRAGIAPADVQTGAVIITGESSRKENAALAAQSLSAFAGEFVVATAGPDLESIIAAKGAGAEQYAREHGCTVANLDVGGGTTNIAVFDCGELVAKGCWDIGGRLVRVQDGRITYISPRCAAVAQSLGVQLQVGDTASPEALRRIAGRMAELLGEALGILPTTPLCEQLRTPGSSILKLGRPVARISFSGGVADYIYSPSRDWFRHGDIGPLLGDSIRQSRLCDNIAIIPSQETIRATVIGAGSYTTTVSGSTIFFTREGLFPFKNLPVFAPDADAEIESLSGNGERLRAQAAWFLQESGGENILFCFRRLCAPGYRELCNLADALVHAAEAQPPGRPLLVLVEDDFAKSLGQALARRLNGARPVVCVDSICAQQGDYVDLGRPLMNGMAVTVVVKTLIFG